MKQTANPFADFGNAAVEAARQLTRISMDSAERAIHFDCIRRT